MTNELRNSKHSADDALAYEKVDALRSGLLSRAGPLREQHGRGEGLATLAPPDAVAFPESVAEIQAIMRLCSQHNVPVIPFGSGTSLEGHVTAPHGGLCIDLSKMNKIIEVRQEDLDCTIEPGVTREQLNAYLRDQGLFFPIDPGANATLGGMASTRASGTNAVRYGTMRDIVLSADIVLSDGRLITTGGRARKSSAGYDLTRLFIGSEGTLGIICQLRVRLFGIPESISSAVCQFDSLEGAVQCVAETIQVGVPVARMELLDEVQIAACNAYSNLSFELAPTLFFEFHGSEASVHDQTELVEQLAQANGGLGFQWETTTEKRAALWKARHDAYFAAKALRPGTTAAITDVCVPMSRLVECIRQTRADIDMLGLQAPIVGHVGDGNFHVIILIDENNSDEVARFQDFDTQLVARALEMEGTCTGEHGIGSGKRAKLVNELGEGAVELMRFIKQGFDPTGIMNPGKIV